MERNVNLVSVCVKVKNLPKPPLGSVKDVCSECKEDIWVSPNILANDTARDARKLCRECLLRVATEEDWDIIGVVPIL